MPREQGWWAGQRAPPRRQRTSWQAPTPGRAAPRKWMPRPCQWPRCIRPASRCTASNVSRRGGSATKAAARRQAQHTHEKKERGSGRTSTWGAPRTAAQSGPVGITSHPAAAPPPRATRQPGRGQHHQQVDAPIPRIAAGRPSPPHKGTPPGSPVASQTQREQQTGAPKDRAAAHPVPTGGNQSRKRKTYYALTRSWFLATRLPEKRLVSPLSPVFV